MYGFGVEFRYKRLVGCRTVQRNRKYRCVSRRLGIWRRLYSFQDKQIGNVLSIVKDPANRWISREYAEKIGMNPALAENPNARFPRMSYGNLENNSQLSNFWIDNAKYLRLSEVNINYSVNDTQDYKEFWETTPSTFHS